MTMLHEAVTFGRADVVRILLEHGAIIIPSNQGITAYDLAKFYNNPQILALFEQFGLNQTRNDKSTKEEESISDINVNSIEDNPTIRYLNEEPEEDITSYDSDMSQPNSEQFILAQDIEQAQKFLESLGNFNDQELIMNYNMSRAELINQLKRIISRKAAL